VTRPAGKGPGALFENALYNADLGYYFGAAPQPDLSNGPPTATPTP
jgi:hypothetical protein